jgi:hypothetical protein
MNNIYPYQKRNWQIPEGFVLQNLPNNQYTDEQITQLFYIFLSCYSERINNSTSNKIKGCNSEIDCETKYLLISLFILQGWYNPSLTYPSVTISVSNSPVNENLYIVSNNGDTDTTYLIGTINGTNFSSNLSSLQSTLSLGFTAVEGSTPNTIVVSTLIPYFIQLLYYNSSWSQFTGMYFNPCISVSTIEKIIEKCLSICGCSNCISTEALTQDNYYVPLGQNIVIPEGQVIINPIPFL